MRERGSGELGVWTNDLDREGNPRGIKPISADELEEEAKKLERLCWDNGFRPNDTALNQISRHFAKLIEGHLNVALDARQRGRLKAPKPSLQERSTSWQALLKA